MQRRRSGCVEASLGAQPEGLDVNPKRGNAAFSRVKTTKGKRVRRLLMVWAMVGLALGSCAIAAIARNSSLRTASANGQNAAGDQAIASGTVDGIKSDKTVVVVATGMAPRTLAVDARGYLFVMNASAPNRIFTLTGLADLATNQTTNPAATGRLALIAGTGVAGSLGDGGSALNAQFDLKLDSLAKRSGMAVASDGTIFVADTLNSTVRRIAGSDSSEPGIVRSIAGRWAGKQSITLSEPLGLAVDRDGNLYVADYAAGTIDVVPAAITSAAQEEQIQVFAHVVGPASIALTTDGGKLHVASPDTGAVFEIETQTRAIRPLSAFPPQKADAGEAKAACAGATASAGAGSASQGAATQTAVCPAGVAVDGAGNLFVADANAGKILRVDAKTAELTTAASGLRSPGEISFDANENLYVAEQGAGRIVKFVNMGQDPATLSITMPNSLPPPPAPRVCPPPAAGVPTPVFNFCDEPTGGSTGEQAFVLMNNSSAAVSGLTFSFTGANPADFQATSNTCATSLASGAQCAVNVEFVPLATGSRAAVLTVSDSAGDTATANVTGTGDNYELALNGSPMEQSVIQGGVITFNFSITPDAVFGGDVTIVCPTNLPAMTTCTQSATTVTITPGTAATFSVKFETTYNGVTGGFPGNGSIPGTMPRMPGGRDTPGGPGAMATIVALALIALAKVFALSRPPRLGFTTRNRATAVLVVAALLICGVAWLGGCKKHGVPSTYNTPPGSTTMTIQGTAQNAGRGVTITLDVVGRG